VTVVRLSGDDSGAALLDCRAEDEGEDDPVPLTICTLDFFDEDSLACVLSAPGERSVLALVDYRSLAYTALPAADTPAEQLASEVARSGLVRTCPCEPPNNQTD